jgi:Cof subfamily protein (haloacid dehalogenase superfamily)
MIKLLATDLDGTLFDDLKNIPELNLTEIEKFQEDKGLLVLASGRPLEGVFPLHKLLNNQYTFSYNGALIYDNLKNKVINKTTISYKDIYNIYKISKEYNLDFHLFKDDGTLYTTRHNEYTDIEAKINNIKANLCDISDFKESDRFFKCAIVSSKENLDNLQKNLKLDYNNLQMVRSSDIFLEFLDINTSKGNALKSLIKYLGLKNNEVIACGDHENDMSMFEIGVIGCAVSNAIPELLKKATYITLSNNDGGVGYILKKLREK